MMLSKDLDIFKDTLMPRPAATILVLMFPYGSHQSTFSDVLLFEMERLEEFLGAQVGHTHTQNSMAKKCSDQIADSLIAVLTCDHCGICRYIFFEAPVQAIFAQCKTWAASGFCALGPQKKGGRLYHSFGKDKIILNIIQPSVFFCFSFIVLLFCYDMICGCGISSNVRPVRVSNISVRPMAWTLSGAEGSVDAQRSWVSGPVHFRISKSATKIQY